MLSAVLCVLSQCGWVVWCGCVVGVVWFCGVGVMWLGICLWGRGVGDGGGGRLGLWGRASAGNMWGLGVWARA